MVAEETGLGVGGRRRLMSLAGLGTAVMLILAGRFYQLEVVRHQELLHKAQSNSVFTEYKTAPRGRIWDRHGKLLVTNEPDFQLEGIPFEVPHDAKHLQWLAAATGQAPHKLKARIDKALKVGPLEPFVFAKALSTPQVVASTKLLSQFKGLRLVIRERRRFAAGLHATHSLGYMGEITAEELKELRPKGYMGLDRIGKEGLERTYDGWLRGYKGVSKISIDALGRTVKTTEVRPPKPGADLHLALDWELQKVAEKSLQEMLDQLRQENQEFSGGSVVVMEAQTGAVRALVSLPQYDPRPFARGITQKEYTRLINQKGLPLLHRAVQSIASPGSTFKLVTSSAALSNGLCSAGSVFYCGGSYAGANCFVTSGHGSIGFEGSLAHSCDVVYYMLGVKLGVERLSKHAKTMGLGQQTGIDLPGESEGILPTADWKWKNVGDKWYEGDTVNFSIGQGFLLVTPIQMAVVTAAVANGGKVVKPHLVQQVMSYQGRVLARPGFKPLRRLQVKPNLWAAVRQGMRGAVLYGTGGACNSEFVQVAGKTGTVENMPNSENLHGRNHTWFVSFAPYEHPEIVVVVMCEKSGGYGGSRCAPVARKIYDYLYGPSKGIR
ncbi:MAG: penicillin-binding protein 2 [Candidatus Eremiobacteraeota bacterium]|nr:penicillin-binding protein 2 [Candidatus Eremiobacteraeota bacterium]